MQIYPPLLLDGYKVDHRRQYPEGTVLVSSNLTARGTRVAGLEKVVFFGLQYFVKEYLIHQWNENFFEKDVEEMVDRYNQSLLTYLGPNDIGEQHIRDLHALGYLPIEIWALPEGSNVNLRVPLLVIWNTDDRFFWLTNALETILSTTIWGPCTSATTALLYRQALNKWALKTDPENIGFVPWQGHDFSFRGHFTLEAALVSGAAHLLSFVGTDTRPAIDFLQEYYQADAKKELIGGSVAATEHSVACMGSDYTEETPNDFDYFKRMITKVYPSGIVSLVADTFDFWNVVTPNNGILVQLKDTIMAREGKVVIRPDSGDPVKIVTGYVTNGKNYNTIDEVRLERELTGVEAIQIAGKYFELKEGFGCVPYTGAELTENEVKGMIQCLWEIFGGTISSTGYKQLDSHIGAIYGDSITLDRAEQICSRLEQKGFASTNIVLGIGSFTYQGAVTPDAIVTRDTHMFAVKATYGEIMDENGVRKAVEIYKDPKTDGGTKKSAKGLTAVYEENGEFILKDQATWDEVKNCAFEQVFSNGKLICHTSLARIRENVAKHF
jgi:nicotinamide phosphoribosyltransferase